ncbi:transporter associated domain-containing protein [Nonomuraea sp. NPDC059023]|uniref:transporter associated domain-containing protein n=1 Tax=unclassified Nonomuraea TaxID=2593643 RepID=UPI0036C8737B
MERRADGDFTTVAGLLLAVLCRVPGMPGASVMLDGWHLEITAMDRHAITEVRISADPHLSIPGLTP